jgi:maltose O-acetyltransferase
MKPWRLYIWAKLFSVLPETRLFGLKAAMLHWAGARVGLGVKICLSVTVLGRGPLSIGDHVWIGPQTMIVASALVKTGSYVDIAPTVYIGTGTPEKCDIRGLGRVSKYGI